MPAFDTSLRAAPFTESSSVDQAILEQAADWMVRFQAGEVGPEGQAEFERWRERGPAQQAAWQRAEAVLGAFRQVPANLGRRTLSGARKTRRRDVLRMLALLTGTPTAVWLGWRPLREATADLRTATGEQKRVELADGSRLVLNTSSAVNVAFTAQERLLTLLKGEILVSTGHEATGAARPFLVRTAQGGMWALGTRFSVRQFEDSTHLAVFEGAVEIGLAAGDGKFTVGAGRQTSFTANGAQPALPADEASLLWEQGMLVARDMRLGDLVAELSRYRPGILRCDPTVADMLVSGAFPLRDTQGSLELLERTLPLQVASPLPYWVTVKPR